MDGNPIGAGAGAAAGLQDVLLQRFKEAIANKQMQQEQQRIAIEQQRVNNESDLKRLAIQESMRQHDASQRDAAVKAGTALQMNTPMGADVIDSPNLPLYQASGTKLTPQDPTLSSTNLSGGATAGSTAPRIVGIAGQQTGAPNVAGDLTQTNNPGHKARLIDEGLPVQQQQAARDAALNRYIAHPNPGDALQAMPESERGALLGHYITADTAANKPKTIERQAGTLNGREMFANFSEGKYTDPATGADISGAFKPMPPASMRVQIGAGANGMGGETFDANRPDPATANKVDGKTGMTPNALYQNALTYALENRIPAGGRASVGQAQNARMAIQNKAGAIAAAAGTDLPTVQAQYRANAATLGKLLPIAQQTANYANTAKDNIALAQQQSPQVTRTDSQWVNQVANAFVKGAMPAANLTKFEVYIYTAAREYAKVTSGGAMSAQGLSDSAAREASKLLNASQSPEAFAAAVDAMQHDMDNVTSRQFEGVRTVSDTIGRFLAAANGVPLGTSSGNAPPPGGGGGDLIRVQGPGGKTGRVPKGTTLPTGWTVVNGG
jgi:hypothetical protein